MFQIMYISEIMFLNNSYLIQMNLIQTMIEK